MNLPLSNLGVGNFECRRIHLKNSYSVRACTGVGLVTVANIELSSSLRNMATKNPLIPVVAWSCIDAEFPTIVWLKSRRMCGLFWIFVRVLGRQLEGPASENLFRHKLDELRDPLHATQQVKVLRPDGAAKR